MVDDTHTQVIDNHSYPSLDWYARQIHDTAVVKGFWDLELGREEDIELGINLDKIMAKLALIHSEVTEILEAIRKNKGSVATVEEFGDAIIRLLDLYSAMWQHDMVEDSLQELFEVKMAKNKNRPALHGHKWG